MVPLIFLYPESNQSDFIQNVEEDDSLIDHLNVITPAFNRLSSLMLGNQFHGIDYLITDHQI